MAVKGNPTEASTSSLEQDVAEFTSLLAMTLHDLKSVASPGEEIRAAFERASLGRRHAPALLAVAASGPISVTDLANRLGLLLSSTSSIVGELSRAGLLERAEDEHDRRRTIVRVQHDYREAMEAWLQAAFAPVRRTFERISPRARADFMEVWRTLQQEAAAQAPDAAHLDCES